MADPRSRWEVVYDDLRGRIVRGDLGEGDQVPGELDLSEVHGVSRSTVRSALQRLQQEGLITEGRGRLGRQVRADNPLIWNLHSFEGVSRRDDPAAGLDDWAQQVADQGRRPEQEVTPTLGPSTSQVAKWLLLPAGSPVVTRSRVRSVDGRPWQLSVSHFPGSWAQGTVLMEPGDVVVAGGILAGLGHQQKRVHDEIRARMPTPSESRQLEIPVGTPVIEHLRIGYDTEDMPVRAMITVAPGDKHILVYELEIS